MAVVAIAKHYIGIGASLHVKDPSQNHGTAAGEAKFCMLRVVIAPRIVASFKYAME
jgi:hypothetical protein